MSSWQDKFSELQDRLKGPAFIAGTPGYEDEVAGHNWR